ncbi:hypothetical protein [Hydrogenivirga sp. 128-5-R1-1]|uniref:hypothetical protein n=1 Tax=Hydrogenivirga sp. 128-5-R1-1 TaxID=392423 RepID=UPI00015F1706|nr:hypothetical protein [Hydrogenivirga sp. 128-5-R1-1]EDP76090.1 hypothetical protein HG1285_18009 [Hydrogenivirga sp. 128-5-R1-1]
MKPINPKKSKVFSFLIGLIYGYRTADMELKVMPLEEFDPNNHEGFDVYFLDKKSDRVSKNEPIEEPSHIVAIFEDFEAKKVRLYIYKS